MTTEQQLQDVIAVLRAKRDEQKALRATKWHLGYKQEARGHREAAKAFDRAVGLVKRIRCIDSTLGDLVNEFIDNVESLA